LHPPSPNPSGRYWTATDGLWKQRYVGKSWDYDKNPSRLGLEARFMPADTPKKFIEEARTLTAGTYQAGQGRDTLAAFGRQLGVQKSGMIAEKNSHR
jgi:hypothetical protein